ncbi:MAG: transposase [Candidatus Omnitrophota bacterium]
MPVHTVSRIVSESDYKIWAMLERYVNTALVNNDYITLFVDILKKQTIFIAEGNDQGTIKLFVNDLKAYNGNAEKVTDVSGDMWPAFIRGVEDNLPNAKITFDRFHIMKIIGIAVDMVRKQEACTQYSLLKGTKYIFLDLLINL